MTRRRFLSGLIALVVAASARLRIGGSPAVSASPELPTVEQVAAELGRGGIVTPVHPSLRLALDMRMLVDGQPLIDRYAGNPFLHDYLRRRQAYRLLAARDPAGEGTLVAGVALMQTTGALGVYQQTVLETGRTE